ncbi:hypothetical protein BH10ACI2_BH10ACI2_15710 [soil metagenome]
MRHIKLAIITIMALTLFAGAAAAQKKTVKKTTPVKKPPVAVVPPLDVRAGREKVDNQLSNVNDYLNKLGPIAANLETAIADKNANKLKPATAKKVEEAQQQLIKSLQDLKIGLTALESEFRTKSALQKYLPSLQGITNLAAQAEDSAVAAKFVAAKEPLRNVGLKLTDTLNVMPR